MDILPNFFYLFQSTPIWLPKSFFHQLRRLFSKFVWSSTRHRLNQQDVNQEKRNAVEWVCLILSCMIRFLSFSQFQTGSIKNRTNSGCNWNLTLLPVFLKQPPGSSPFSPGETGHLAFIWPITLFGTGTESLCPLTPLSKNPAFSVDLLSSSLLGYPVLHCSPSQDLILNIYMIKDCGWLTHSYRVLSPFTFAFCYT